MTMSEQVLDNFILLELRSRRIISNEEVAINSGDLYYAKNVLTNDKRLIEPSLIRDLKKNETVTESRSKTLLKG